MLRVKLFGPWRWCVPLVALTACSPTLDWRDVSPDGSDVRALFPCKPERLVRLAKVADARVTMSLHSCKAAGVTYALSFADIQDPSRAAPALASMRAALQSNLNANAAPVEVFQMRGASPNAPAVRVRMQGTLPDGAPMQEQAAFFAVGPRVYQAVVLGAKIETQAADVFFEGLKLR